MGPMLALLTGLRGLILRFGISPLYPEVFYIQGVSDISANRHLKFSNVFQAFKDCSTLFNGFKGLSMVFTGFSTLFKGSKRLSTLFKGSKDFSTVSRDFRMMFQGFFDGYSRVSRVLGFQGFSLRRQLREMTVYPSY